MNIAKLKYVSPALLALAMLKVRTWTVAMGLALGALIAPPTPAQESQELLKDTGTLSSESAERVHRKPAYSPYVGRKFPTRPYFGDTHLHTGYSMDAGAFGARLSPRDAYRFARGEEVTASSGQPARLARPLDFLVVADHSDGMGFFPLIFGGDPAIMADPQGRRWHDMVHYGKGPQAAIEIITSFGKGTISKAIMPLPGTPAYRSAWQETIKAAEEFNEPGRFTAINTSLLVLRTASATACDSTAPTVPPPSRKATANSSVKVADIFSPTLIPLRSMSLPAL